MKKRGSKRRKQRGGQLTSEDKIILTDAFKAITFKNGDGPLDENKINDIVNHLSNLHDIDEFFDDVFFDQILDQIDPRMPFESMEQFDTWIKDNLRYVSPTVDREMEIDTDVLEDNTIDIKSKLNGGKKRRKTRRIRIRKRKTRRLRKHS